MAYKNVPVIYQQEAVLKFKKNTNPHSYLAHVREEVQEYELAVSVNIYTEVVHYFPSQQKSC